MVSPAHHAGADLADFTAGRRLIAASNRGPVECYKTSNGRLTTKRGAGGVVTALAALARNLPLTWIAAAMTPGDRLAFSEDATAAREVRLGRQPLRVRYVAVPEEAYRLHYDEISNHFLWLLQHYLWDPATWPTFTDAQHAAWEHGYRVVNQAIADAVIAEVQAGSTGRRRPGASDGADAIVLVQDYHLYLTSGFVRQRLPRATIQQFIHIPWPSVRYWQLLPEDMLIALFEGLAANDVLGFQTRRDARSFLECVHEFLPDARVDLDSGRFVRRRHRLLVRAYPITVDADEVRKTLASAAGRLAAAELAPHLADGARVLVRVDRLDPTKNIVRGLLAYEDLLHRHPELHGAVRHLAFLVPSRQGLDLYRRYEREVRRTIGRINRQFSTKEWKPVVAYFDNNRARALVALRRADVVLVNPILDGMNLVVKEAAIANDRDGVLILSRTAGAYCQLTDSVLPITPLDVAETSEQLYEALSMSEGERHRRAELARAIVGRDTLTDWIANQLHDAAQIHPVSAIHPRPALRRAG
jgi:trehalose 6-phosphate synthase